MPRASESAKKVGDIAIYGVPSQMSLSLLGSIEGMILNARTEAGNITVTDTSDKSARTFHGSACDNVRLPA